MKILGYGIYQDHALGGDILFAKGLRLNGCDVAHYDFKQRVKQLGQKQADALLIEQARQHDVLLIGKGERLDAATLKSISAHTQVALWYGDIRPQVPEYLQQLLPYTDFFFMTSGGSTLKQYHELGVKQASSYIFNPFDPDLLVPEQPPVKDLDVVFTGTGYRFAGDERQQVLDYLKQRADVSFFGGAEKFTGNKLSFLQKLKKELSRLDKHRKVRGEAYFDVIRRAKIGIGVNAVHHVNKYTSDRLTHYAGFGSFMLMRDFDGLRELFSSDEIVSFKDTAQLEKLIDYYLQHGSERQEIAKRAQKKVVEQYHCANMAALMLDVIRNGKSNRFSWAETVR